MAEEVFEGVALPQGAYRWNRAHRGAFKKGMKAFADGVEYELNPYADKRKSGGQLTWSRAFICCWNDGWRWAKNAPKRAAA